MGEERLVDFALLNVHQDNQTTPGEVIVNFDETTSDRGTKGFRLSFESTLK